ncbi:MAG: hypothetical protein V4629_11570 [Pseudomonadota bacterium]
MDSQRLAQIIYELCILTINLGHQDQTNIHLASLQALHEEAMDSRDVDKTEAISFYTVMANVYNLMIIGKSHQSLALMDKWRDKHSVHDAAPSTTALDHRWLIEALYALQLVLMKQMREAEKIVRKVSVQTDSENARVMAASMLQDYFSYEKKNVLMHH